MIEDRYAAYIGIDYSGAQDPDARLPGLQVYEACLDAITHVLPPSSARQGTRNWTRRELAEWLLERIRTGPPLLIGIDHGLSFPMRYFRSHGIASWNDFLEDFTDHWPTHQAGVRVDDVRPSAIAAGRSGASTELRLTERWSSSAKSVFQFDVQGSVAKSTHAGLPWIWQMRHALKSQLHVWPFDGWSLPDHKSTLAEVYPSLLRNRFPREKRTVDQQDAYAIASWLRDSSQRGILEHYLHPPLTRAEQELAELEGWILGIT